ncbi:MAG: hypothetical protein QXO54_02820 [Candidatus Methanomethylicaceae archaeon]
MRVRHVTDREIFWSLGRGEGDEIIGVEISLEGKENVSRRIISRGKYGRERVVFQESYLIEDYKAIVRSEAAFLSSAERVDKDLMLLIMEAIESLRRVCERL